MLMVCPNCATSYQVEPSSLGATGRSVRCVRCQKTWFAANTSAMTAIALSHHQDMAAFSTGAAPVHSLAAAGAGGPMAEDAPSALHDAPAELPIDQPPAEELVRDDRGPAPLPEPREYELRPEFVTVDDALAPGDPDGALRPAANTVPEDIESVAARRIRRPPAHRRVRSPVPGWAAASLLLIAVNVGLIAWRADVVRLLPQTAAVYAAIGLDVNQRGLVFTELVTRKETRDGVQVLVVEGIIKSTSNRDTDAPRLRFAVRNASGQEIYSWTSLPDRTVIAAGATLPFRSRLASPPPEAHAVLVRFFNRRDLVAGLQ